jgi:hypothetical protein
MDSLIMVWVDSKMQEISKSQCMRNAYTKNIIVIVAQTFPRKFAAYRGQRWWWCVFLWVGSGGGSGGGDVVLAAAADNGPQQQQRQQLGISRDGMFYQVSTLFLVAQRLAVWSVRQRTHDSLVAEKFSSTAKALTLCKAIIT